MGKRLVILFITICIILGNMLPVVNAESFKASSEQYFKVEVDNLSVYDNSSGSLVKVGELEKGMIFKQNRVLGNWIEIYFGENKRYIWKASVSPSNGEHKSNLKNPLPNVQYPIKTITNTSVYDNSNGSLTKIAELPEGLAFSIIDEVGDWAKVYVSGKIAYIHKTGYSLNFNSSIKYFISNEDKVPVKINENGILKDVGYLEKGQVYSRVRDVGNWHEIKFGDQKGYVWKNATIPSLKAPNKMSSETSSIKFKVLDNEIPVYDNSSGKLLKMATLNKLVEYPVIDQIGNWYKISFSGREGYVYHSGGEIIFSSHLKVFKPKSDQLEVFKSVNGNLVPLAILKENQSFERIRDVGNWHEISIAGDIGYVWEKATEPVLSSNSFKKQVNHLYQFKTTEQIAVYDNSSGKLIQFADLLPNATYRAIAQEGNWLKLLFAGREGYVHTSGLNLTFNENINYFKVIQDKVNVVKTEAGVTKNIGELVKGQQYKFIGESGNWLKVMYGNQVGYVWKLGTEPIIKKSYTNDDNASEAEIGTLEIIKKVDVYDNTSGKLVPFIQLDADQKYPYYKKMGDWYKINVLGREGYVYSNAVKATPKQYYKNIVNPFQTYSYNQMVKDINSLKEMYPGIISTKVIGKSVDGRDLWAVKLGRGNVEVFFNGSHHAREHITTNLIMEQIDTYAQSYVQNTKVNGFNAKDILNKTSIWFVPMVNPDGVTLVQQGYQSAKNPQLVLMINNYSKDFSAWKANIRGVDLNRQYPANWNYIKSDPGKPSSYNYKGPRPLSEPEAAALVRFTNEHQFKTAVAYHSSGEVLYWNYKQDSYRYNRDKVIALMINRKTGYRLINPGSNPSGGGYTDWFIMQHRKPGFTPELSPYVGNRPVPIGNFSRIWYQNDNLGLMLANEAYNNRNTR